MKILINPDVHGRSFWKYSIEHKNKFDKIVFLGDYLDPYSPDLLKTEEDNFKEIIQFKKDNLDKVILLLGNHDGHYISHAMLKSSRCSFWKVEEYRKLFLDNIDLFQLIYIHDEYLFSHAGVYQEWLKLCHLNIDNLINYDLDKLAHCLNFLDRYRGGDGDVGSCIWADISDSETQKLLEGYYHIFGHTQLRFPVITKEFACLDCRVPFSLDCETGKIKKLMNNPTEW
ncbi:metallophosphoesterase [Intestinibacter sp.]|uniref:metallophosphoesterase n=1 Tax=Intestinibacter sp. TaxID=1965304 RepID=UPI003F167B2A